MSQWPDWRTRLAMLHTDGKDDPEDIIAVMRDEIERLEATANDFRNRIRTIVAMGSGELPDENVSNPELWEALSTCFSNLLAENASLKEMMETTSAKLRGNNQKLQELLES
jgi:hypothetical protein